MVRFSYDIQKCIGKYGTDRLRIRRSIYKSSTNYVRIKGNSWQFWTIREIFSLHLGIKCHLPCLGITSKINVYRIAAVVLALHLECQYQLLKVRRRLRRKQNWRGDPDFLTLWLEKLLVKVYHHHHHQPVNHQSLTVLINLPLLVPPGACAFSFGGVVTLKGCLRFPLLLFPCLFSLFRIPE